MLIVGYWIGGAVVRIRRTRRSRVRPDRWVLPLLLVIMVAALTLNTVLNAPPAATPS